MASAASLSAAARVWAAFSATAFSAAVLASPALSVTWPAASRALSAAAVAAAATVPLTWAPAARALSSWACRSASDLSFSSSMLLSAPTFFSSSAMRLLASFRAASRATWASASRTPTPLPSFVPSERLSSRRSLLPSAPLRASSTWAETAPLAVVPPVLDLTSGTAPAMRSL